MAFHGAGVSFSVRIRSPGPYVAGGSSKMSASGARPRHVGGRGEEEVDGLVLDREVRTRLHFSGA
jgi:hypothetical protein